MDYTNGDKENQQILHRKLDNLEVFNNDKSLGLCLRKQRNTIIVKPRLSSACMSLISAFKNAWGLL